MSATRRRRSTSQSEETPLATGWATFNDDYKENMGRDRTSEFQSALKSLQNRAQVPRMHPNVGNFQNKAINHNVQQYAEFMQTAKIIGRNISGTYGKLEELALCAKTKSLFDDKSPRINELTNIIKDDINMLNKDIAKLQNIAKSQRTHGKHLQSHSSGVVVGLQSKLASISSDFKQVLQVRTENLKEQKHRQDQFSQGPVTSSLPPSAFTRYHQGSVLFAEDNYQSQSGGDVAIDLGDPMLRQRNIQSQLQLADETDVVLERANAMQSIESTIVELGSIFQQLATMVKEQDEIVNRIGTNVDEAEMNVEAAHTELLRYFRSVASNRWLMIKVFGMLLFFFVIFIFLS